MINFASTIQLLSVSIQVHRICEVQSNSVCPFLTVWRYAAITDRRIRATRWSLNDLAASNAIFWTTDGWHGGEEMVLAAAPHALRSPEHTHVEIFSLTMLKTIITTMQGISALYSLIGLLAGVSGLSFTNVIGVDMVFFPLAILGLLRLCAAAWLTEDFEYSSRVESSSRMTQRGSQGRVVIDLDNDLKSGDFLDPFLSTPYQPAPRFKTPSSSWSSRIFRTCYLVLVGGVWALAFLYFIPGVLGPYALFTTTSFLTGLFYFIFLTVSVLLYIFYFFRGETTSTLLPCISSTWYRAYTLLVMSFMSVLIVIASIETNRTPIGQYASVPALVNLECTYRNRWWPLTDDSSFFGLVSHQEIVRSRSGQDFSGLPVLGMTRNNASLNDRFWLYDFHGYCVGQLGNFST